MPAVSKKQQRFFGIVRAIQKGEQKPTTPETAKAASGMKMKSVKKFAKTKHKGLPEKKKMKEQQIPDLPGLGGGGGGTDAITDKAPYKSLKKKMIDVGKIATIPARFMLNIKSPEDPLSKFATDRMSPADKVSSAITDYKRKQKNLASMPEESCGKGMYYCRDDQKCKPIPKGTKVRKDGMLVKESPDKLSDFLKPEKEYDLTNARERMIYNRLKKAGKNPLIKKIDESIKDELLQGAEKRRKTYKQFRKDARTAGQKPLKRGEVRKYDKQTGKWVSNK